MQNFLRPALPFVILVVIVAALLLILYVFEVISVDELRDYSEKAGLTVAVLALASGLIRAFLSGKEAQ